MIFKLELKTRTSYRQRLDLFVKCQSEVVANADFKRRACSQLKASSVDKMHFMHNRTGRKICYA